MKAIFGNFRIEWKWNLAAHSIWFRLSHKCACLNFDLFE